MVYVIIFVIIFATIVVVHEWGHFIAAKKCGVAVNEFAIGMGPKLWSTKKEETLYTIRLLPIGGYCAMEGENEQSNNPMSLMSKSPLQRMLIFVAGAFMNVILTWVLMLVVLGYNGYNSNVIANVIPDSPIALAGVQADDTIIAIDGVPVTTQTEIMEISSNGNASYNMTIQDPSGTIRNVIVTPQIDANGNRIFGFYSKSARYGFFETIWQSFLETGWMLVEVLQGFWMLISGSLSVKEMAGIVGVAQLTTQVWDASIQESVMYAIMNMARIAAILSANLAVLNLLPFPALDGGRIFFTLIEIVRGKPLNQEKEAMFHFAGFILLMILMVVVLYNDIIRLIA
ncbi:M50 family metallopeptidase [Candidatus Epulonipiscium viviparus]|uniref:M50 family metallopeptidase n=1 Tax=Candidatus Epulonipiscium viviparus TaxID=420336 RepID=UPI00016BFCBF|nr:site-2 protease family protein [Candidatus Epulopiscium viviparus]